MADARVRWQGGMALFAEAGSGHQVMMDASPDVGGANRGFRPTELTLISLMGCTGIDVLSILQKMRVTVDAFDMEAEADRREQHPKIFEHVVVSYRLQSPDCTPAQLERAVTLSAERYCTVSAMLEPPVEILRAVYLNGQPVSA